jgi:peptide/nickel transport system substrate-binding protein
VLSQSWAYNPSTPHREHNPAEARRLLDAAGWVVGPGGVRVRNGVTLTLALAANKEAPANVAVATQIAEQLREVGIDAKLALVGRDTLLRDYLARRAFHIVLASWEAQGVDPDVRDYWHSPGPGVGGLNFSGWSNRQADQALDTALLTLDVGSRATEYATFQDAFAQDVPGVVLYSPLYTYATRAPASGVSLPSTDMLSPAYRFDTIANWYLK